MTGAQGPDPLARLAKKKPREVRVSILLDDQLATDVAESTDAEFSAQSLHDRRPTVETEAALTAAKKTAERARKAADQNTVEFTFAGIGRDAWEALVADHPATSDQTQDAISRGGFLQWNPKTFPPAVVAACCASPVLDPVVVAGWWTDPAWSVADTDALFDAASEANLVRRVRDLGKGYGSTRS